MNRGIQTLIPAATAAFLGFTTVHAQSDDVSSVANMPKPLRSAQANTITLPSGAVVHRTPAAVANQRLVRVPGSATLVALWDEANENGAPVPRYAISLDGQSLSGRVRENSVTVDLQYASFDPLRALPQVDPLLAATAQNEIYLVQFVVWPLPEFRAGLEAMGARVLRYLPENSVAVRMTPGQAATVGALPHVRWVGAYHPAYRLDPAVLAQIVSGADAEVPIRYSIECFERGMGDQGRVGDRIAAIGGIVEIHTSDQFRMEATLTHAQVLDVARLNEVNFIEPWGGPGGLDTNLVRSIGGADFVESTLGYTGQGVRGEVFDSEIRFNNPAAGNTHQEFSTFTPILHSADAGNPANPHGTSVFGICFSRGASANARGLLPGAEARIYYDYTESSQFGGATSRLTLAQQLVNPAGPYRAVFQTSSIGSTQVTTYTTISAEVDDYLFQTRLLSTQSQSNTGNQTSRPQAWAKNIVSVGAFYHLNTASRADDTWPQPAGGSCGSGGAASIGPASDGRLKPDLSFFYDCTFNASNSSNTSYTEFGGTSGATPSVGGYFGLFFQMWHEGVWKGRGGASTVFNSRASMTTAKAALVNSAFRYTWTAGGPNASLTRAVQGWGVPDLRNLHSLRNRTFIVDEEGPLAPLATRNYTVLVGAGEPGLAVTMAYVDPQGNPAVQATHRVNDLSLRVISPTGTAYWGNNGLTAGNTSTSGGVSNTKDTVENVFVANPAAGVWTIEVHGDVITADTHPSTAAVDADFSIWATGCTQTNFKKTPTYGYSVQSNGNDHLYRIDMNTGEAIDLGLVGNGDLEGMSFGPDGNLFGITGSATAATGQIWDISIPPGSQVGGSFARTGFDAGLDYFNGTMYNLEGNGSTSSNLYRINMTTGAPTLIGTSTNFGDGLAIDGLGNAFTADVVFTFSLYSVNLTNGAMTLVGPLGISTASQGGLSFGPDGTLWLITSTGDLYTINTATGAATLRARITIGGTPAGSWEGLAIDQNSALALMGIPAFSSSFTGSTTRGYWFTAPYNGSIRGIRVPNEGSQNVQNAEIVRLAAAPPAFPASTNNFVSLGRFDNQPANVIIPCDIPVAAGDIIGVLGACGTTTMVNSYGPAAANPFPSNMKGIPTVLRRLLMQDNLFDNAAHDLSTEALSSVSRVELYYTDGRQNLYLDGDKVATGSMLETTPLPTVLGTATWTNGELVAFTDPEMTAAGSQGNVLDGLNAPNATCDLYFNFDVDSATFLYGGNIGGFTMEAYNAAGALVDVFSQADTFSGEPAGPRTVAGPGIRRLHWFENSSGSFAGVDNLRIHATYDCYANCDHSTTPPVLNVLDFSCFLNAFAAGSGYANCDGSTTPPVLNVLDFSCFLNRFAAGCN